MASIVLWVLQPNKLDKLVSYVMFAQTLEIVMTRRLSVAMDRLHEFVMGVYTFHVRNPDMGLGGKLGVFKAIDDVNTVLSQVSTVIKTQRMMRLSAARQRSAIAIPRRKRRIKTTKRIATVKRTKG